MGDMDFKLAGSREGITALQVLHFYPAMDAFLMGERCFFLLSPTSPVFESKVALTRSKCALSLKYGCMAGYSRYSRLLYTLFSPPTPNASLIMVCACFD